METSGKLNAKSKTDKNTKNGNTFYYFTLSGNKSIFIGSSQVSNAFPVSKAGDSVEVTFDNDSQDLIYISMFENKSVGK